MTGMEDRTKILMAVAASVGANCHPCLEYHVGKALECGMMMSEIMEAVQVARTVRGGANASMDRLALKLAGNKPSQGACDGREPSCC
jgi:AhpD family alkylhydroperoxidase